MMCECEHPQTGHDATGCFSFLCECLVFIEEGNAETAEDNYVDYHRNTRLFEREALNRLRKERIAKALATPPAFR